jgi:hypothetical protein
VFKRFFSALASLASNVESLSASFAEANRRFRQNILGEGNGDLPALEHTESDEPPKIGRKRQRPSNSSTHLASVRPTRLFLWTTFPSDVFLALAT